MAGIVLAQVRFVRQRPVGEPEEDVMVNTYHYDSGTVPLSPESTDKFGTAWAAFWGQAITQYQSSEIVGEAIRFYAVPATPGILGDPIEIAPITGMHGNQAPSTELPPQVAATVTWQTGPRRHWGRIYIGGLVTSVLGTGRISSTVVDTIGAAAKAFQQTLLTDGLRLVTFDRKNWVANEVAQVSMDDVFDVQRRRRFDKPHHRYQSV